MLSVLVAVHNSSQWLPQCLDSLRYNTYKDIEVIAVDDCSTDNSLQILNSYAAADSRFKVIHLDKNGGAAHARNIALQHATGEWAMMLDSDDWIGDFDDRLAESLAPPLTPKAPLDPPLRGEGEEWIVTFCNSHSELTSCNPHSELTFCNPHSEPTSCNPHSGVTL